MFHGSQIKQLVDLLCERDVLLYHSCQFKDFKSYLKLGGIPSRQKLTEEHLDFTTFETDDADHINGVWDKVFLNLQDFGTLFQSRNGVPTTYGPIQFRVKPGSLYTAHDVAIALRSAGSPGFNRNEEALKDVNQVNRLFQHPLDAGTNKTRKLKMGNELKAEFKKDYVSCPEVSLSIKTGLIPLSLVDEIIVDTYYFEGDYLFNHIFKLTCIDNYQTLMKKVKFRKSTQGINNEIASLLLKKDVDLDTLISLPEASLELRYWAEQMREKAMSVQWRRFARYLRQGTLLPVSHEIKKTTLIKHGPIISSSWAIFNCMQCGKMVMGFDKQHHELEKHHGKPVDWGKVG